MESLETSPQLRDAPLSRRRKPLDSINGIDESGSRVPILAIDKKRVLSTYSVFRIA